LNKKRATQWII